MKRYERIIEGGVSEMATAIGYYITLYMEKLNNRDMDCEVRKAIVEAERKPLEKWLNEEVE